MIALIITNIILVVVIGLVGVVLLVKMARDNRPIIIKEAKALREYYEEKLKDVKKKTEEAEENYIEYKELYYNELRRNEGRNDIMSKNVELEAQVKHLNNELTLCEDRLNDMAQENVALKKQVEAPKKPAKKGKK